MISLVWKNIKYVQLDFSCEWPQDGSWSVSVDEPCFASNGPVPAALQFAYLAAMLGWGFHKIQ